jgi:CheY-like chemotaxis protein
MQTKDFQPDDLFTQIQGLVDGLETERALRLDAETADAAKSALLSVVSRELSAPMSSVVAMSELLLKSPLSATQRRTAETLAQSARSLLGAINDVLDFTKLEAGEAELASETVDLHALVKGVASVLYARASEKGLTPGVDMVANCPRFVAGDAARIRQVLMTLVEAALKSTAEGAIRLYVSVNDASDPLTIRFDVTDTGAGLSEAERVTLFRPAADVTRAEGGLDLPIAARLAAAMGGEVGCDSALGQGTLYWFTLQAERAAGEAEAESEQAADAAPKGTLSGHVLVVENNTVNRMLIGAYLEDFGLTYEMVETGAAAILCLAARSYDLVLTEMVLPDYDAEQIAKRIRALRSPSSQVPMVALAARDAADADQDYVAAGMNAHVAKPIRGRALYAALAPFLAAQMEREAFAKAS